ncbi:MAG: hypothetical protein A3H98_03375 [Bacteroidetes bacterium RIFCSPLOWO2_02_FULL_36_8]|nr:MAG: hypothetical protein A3H98_03375 [Bacteroidetes bacterium RIFCSPLOWO2_02_FULL_36_8]OFY69590.1 MAG: hypothetical protein A3G23_10620 [Bacteroidetes bacterium RIFCSPLOWO2_12_FULL_37_12]
MFSCRSSKNLPNEKKETKETKSNIPSSKENKIKTRFAHLLEVDENKIRNIKLYVFINDWLGVPYKYSGKSKQGVDCSGFSSLLLQDVYGKKISGSTENISNAINDISMSNLKEGDLIFFKIESKKPSHMGIYLMNNKFVHASVKLGVTINDLNEKYYKKYFYKAGRL